MPALLRRFSAASSSAANPLLSRRLPLIRDWISPQPTHLLNISLSPYLRSQVNREQPPTSGELPPGHYLVYFPPQLPESVLLPDGSDAEQSPGGPWVRRMWAGGSVHFSTGRGLNIFDRAVLQERVADVTTKGSGADEKMFVWFDRRMYSEPGIADGTEVPMADGKEAVLERRCIVFMKERPGTKQSMPRIVKPPHKPDFSLSFTPTEHLLFRFSALTFNAHKIHFDKKFSMDQEGYPENLCHGPLAQVFLLELLRRNVPDKKIKSFEYRCLAPMYVGEPYKIAGRRVAENSVELWAETPAGGYSVKGLATLE